jgi:hypothetical protein
MRVTRIETVIQWVSDRQASTRWYAHRLGIELTPSGAPYFDNSNGGMPDQRA